MTIYNQEVVKKWAKRLPTEIVMLTIMEQYHWSYEDYMNTPVYILDLIIEKNNTDAKLLQSKK
jgi:hypothetical protein